MSKINADTLPKRGAELSSTDLNEVYTDINDGFPLDSNNLRNEALALPQFDTNGKNGKSGIVLKYSGYYGKSHGAGTIVRANEATTFPYDAPQLIHEEPVVIPLADGDVLRVYLQLDALVSQSNTSPFSIASNDFFWVFWLEWQLSVGGAWTPVEGQSDYEDIIISPATYGGMTRDSNAAIFVNACLIHTHSSSTDIDFPPRRGHCGQYFLLENTGGRSIFGLRIMGRGLMRGGYASSVVNPPDGNCAFITISPPSQHQITVYNSDITYLVQRSE